MDKLNGKQIGGDEMNQEKIEVEIIEMKWDEQQQWFYMEYKYPLTTNKAYGARLQRNIDGNGNEYYRY